MGLFISRRLGTGPIEATIKEALLEQPPPLDQARTRAATKAATAAEQARAAGDTTFHAGRFLIALALFLALLGIAVAAEALDWVSDTAKIYGFASTVLGVIVGFLGGEATGSTTTT